MKTFTHGTQQSSWSSVVDLLLERAEEHPDRPLYSFMKSGSYEGEDITYGQLHRRAMAVGARLQAITTPGNRALLLYPPGLDYISAFFGCLYAGVLAVPAYPPRPNKPMRRLEAVAADAQPAVVLTKDDILDQSQRSFHDVPDVSGVPWISTNQIDCAESDAWRAPGVDGSTVAFLQYTSGSTSTPKGVMVSHGNLIHNSALISEAFEPRPDGWGVCWLPPYHDMGLIGGMLQTMYAGGGSTLMLPIDFLHQPQRWLEAISKTGAIISGGPDFAYDLCVRKVRPEHREGLDLSNWEVAYIGAEPIRSETIDRFTEAFEPCGFRREAFLPCYGLAEATLMVSAGPKRKPPVFVRVLAEWLESNRVRLANGEANARTLVGSGGQQSGQKIVIVDPTTRRTCPADKVGEIWVIGPSVAQGYFNSEELTESTFLARCDDTGEGPFLRTGDLGFLHDGELFVTGRIKDLLIIRGRNFYPQDIECTAQRSHPRFRSDGTAAFSVELGGQENLVVVQEVARYRRELDADELIGAIRQAVASDHDIDVFAVVLLKPRGVPRTSSGKIQRLACRDEFLAERLETVARWIGEPTMETVYSFESQSTPRTAEEIEEQLIKLLSDRLGFPSERFDIHKPFASFGISSVQVVALTSELEKWLGRPLSPTFFYNYSTIAALSQHLADEKITAKSAETGESSPGEDLTAKVVEEVEQLSEEEMKKLISQEIAKLR